MTKSRVEAFSDGVVAILITIMVLELKVPHGADLAALRPLLPTFLSYVLSFVYLGIYWNNHHHLLYAVEEVGGAVLWANLHLLFWLSLIPFCTGWMGENHFQALPTALYGVNLLMSAVAFTILQTALIRQQPRGSKLERAVGKDRKAKISMALYILALIASFPYAPAAHFLYVVVALIWLVPDRRIEKTLEHPSNKRSP